MAKQLLQLTERQLANDKSKSFVEGIKRGRVSALQQILEQADPEIAFEAVQDFMRSAKWKVKAYEAEKERAKSNGAAKGVAA